MSHFLYAQYLETNKYFLYPPRQTMALTKRGHSYCSLLYFQSRKYTDRNTCCWSALSSPLSTRRNFETYHSWSPPLRRLFSRIANKSLFQTDANCQEAPCSCPCIHTRTYCRCVSYIPQLCRWGPQQYWCNHGITKRRRQQENAKQKHMFVFPCHNFFLRWNISLYYKKMPPSMQKATPVKCPFRLAATLT